jgi:3-hydroxyisobutyrate dehydrogenase
MTTAKRIAFLGLGVMGAPMAGHLARKGHRVTAYNRTPVRAAAWLDRHSAEGLDVATAATPAEAAAGQDVVITCVGNDEDLAEVVLGEGGALAAMATGALFIDHTTVSPAIARRVAAEAAERGVAALDSPVSG